jgi:hypothetical protein
MSFQEIVDQLNAKIVNDTDNAIARNLPDGKYRVTQLNLSENDCLFIEIKSGVKKEISKEEFLKPLK